MGKKRVGFNYMEKHKMSHNVKGVKLKREKSEKTPPTILHIMVKYTWYML